MAAVTAIVGASGGVGTTLVAAHLATAKVLQKGSALAFDFCPNNVLRLHFAMEWTDHAGFAVNLVNGRNWHEAAYRSASGVNFLPFGKLQRVSDMENISTWLHTHPDWFEKSMSEIELPPDTHVICDCSYAYPALCNQALSASDLILIVMTPNPLSYANAMQITLEHSTLNTDIAILLNGFNPARSLDQDMLQLLKRNLDTHLAPVVIHHDESLRESFACTQTIFEFAPSSQAALEFHTLATWITARIARNRKAS